MVFAAIESPLKAEFFMNDLRETRAIDRSVLIFSNIERIATRIALTALACQYVDAANCTEALREYLLPAGSSRS